jgi:hypothetical protein
LASTTAAAAGSAAVAFDTWAANRTNANNPAMLTLEALKNFMT